MTFIEAAKRAGDVLGRYRAPVLAGMRQALDLPGIEHARLMRYHLGWEDASGEATETAGGKMLRPAFCLLCCEAAGGDAARALPAAVAIELLHNFTLIHDDIEDASDTRHGRPALWTVAGVARAINAGDGLFVIARRTLLDLERTGVPAARVLAAARLLDDACVALCEGQHADLAFESRESVSAGEYEAMVRGKTAALLGAAAALGALSAGADDASVAAFWRCGESLGMAFQVRDDALGVWGESADTGKPVGDDIRARKKSFPVAYALERLDARAGGELRAIYARETIDAGAVAGVLELLDLAGARAAAEETAMRYHDDAIAALRRLELDADRERDIEALAAFFVHRTA